MKTKKRNLLILSGAIWFGIGLWLLKLGIHFLSEMQYGSGPLLDLLVPLVKTENGIVALLAVALFIGFLKGRYILGKTVKKSVAQLEALPEPAPITAIFTRKYLILIACMMGIGMVVRYFPLDIRGFIDVAVGAALLNGAMLYLREAITYGKPIPAQSQKP